MNNTQKIALKDLIIDESIYDSSRLSDDAIKRYQEMYANGKTKTICVQAKTNKIIDGVHRYHAATKEKIESLYAQVYDVVDSELRALTYQFNRKHGIPYSTIQRNQLITNLYLKDGKSPLQIASVVELSERRVQQILESEGISISSISSADKRRKLDDETIIAILKLLIAEESQEEVASNFEISQQRVSQVSRD